MLQCALESCLLKALLLVLGREWNRYLLVSVAEVCDEDAVVLQRVLKRLLCGRIQLRFGLGHVFRLSTPVSSKAHVLLLHEIMHCLVRTLVLFAHGFLALTTADNVEC